MKTLIIQDLAIAADLDADDMSAVRGGCHSQWKMPSCYPAPSAPSGLPGGYEHAPSSYTGATTVSVNQANNQCQNNPTGNGSAAMCGSIYAYNNQQGYNAIG